MTGSRADYGLLRPIIAALLADPRFELQLVVSSMHLRDEFGLTVREIHADGFEIAGRVEIANVVDSAGLARAFADAIAGFAKSFQTLGPDLLLVLGDRHEILSAALAATALGIPIGHIHGGELSEGSLDDALRHCVTKLAHLHFVAARPYGERVCQLGEQPDRVHIVGAPGLEAIRNLALVDREDVGRALGGIELERPIVALTLHPASLDETAAGTEAREVVSGIEHVLAGRGTIILTLPNDDVGNVQTRDVLLDYAKRKPNVHAFASLGQLRYLSLLRSDDVMVGNSSSGLIEAPAFELPVVNIGSRQQGRLRAANVLDCAAKASDVAQALTRALSPEFRASLGSMSSPYGSGDTSTRVLDVLSSTPLEGLRHKHFFDLEEGPWRSTLEFGSENA